jgi:hypothetical protein
MLFKILTRTSVMPWLLVLIEVFSLGQVSCLCSRFSSGSSLAVRWVSAWPSSVLSSRHGKNISLSARALWAIYSSSHIPYTDDVKQIYVLIVQNGWVCANELYLIYSCLPAAHTPNSYARHILLHRRLPRTLSLTVFTRLHPLDESCDQDCKMYVCIGKISAIPISLLTSVRPIRLNGVIGHVSQIQPHLTCRSILRAQRENCYRPYLLLEMQPD